MSDLEIVDFFERHINELNWYSICQNKSLYEDFFIKYIGKIKGKIYKTLCRNSNISIHFLNNNKFDLNIPEMNIEEVFVNVCDNKNVPLDFIRENINMVCWGGLFKNKSIPRSFFEENIDKINLEDIAEFHGPLFPYFKKYVNKSNCIDILYHEKSFEKLLACEYIYWKYVFKYTTIPADILENYLNSSKFNSLERYFECRNYKYLSLYEYLSWYANLPIDFFEKHMDKLNWDYLCLNKNIPLCFFEKNSNKIVWRELCKNETIPIEFFEKHIDMVNWETISENKNIPEVFIEKYLDKFNDYGLSYLVINNGLSPHFFEKNIDKFGRFWNNLCKNNFKKYLANKRKIMNPVFEEIKMNVQYAPPGVIKALPNGGYGFREMLEKYKNE